jgi:hypothetical protein
MFCALLRKVRSRRGRFRAFLGLKRRKVEDPWPLDIGEDIDVTSDSVNACKDERGEMSEEFGEKSEDKGSSSAVF